MSQSMGSPSFKHYWRIAVALLLLCAPLSAPGFTTATGDVLTITASYPGMSSGRTWTAQKDGQQADMQLTASWLIPPGNFTQATEVSGIIASDTVWTLAGSPYIVTGNVLVQSGVQLSIEPGVQVRFNAERALQIDGELLARGTNDSPITFTSNVGTSPGDWGYILFSDSSTDATYDGSGNYLSGSIIQYAIIEYAGGANVSDNGAVRISASSPCIDHNTIRYNQANGIHVWNNAGPHITYNSIVDNGVVGVVNALGISVWESTATISHNTVARNTNTGIGFRVYNNGIISHNTVFDNAGMGISNYGSATINNNTVFGNTGTGISISYGPHTVSDNVVRDNIVAGDYGGIAAYGYYNTLIVERNVVIGNQATGKGGGIYATGTQANVYVRGNIVANNTAASNGGIYCDVFGQQGTVNNNVVAHNTVSGNGGGISFSECTIRNNAVVGNIASGNGGGVYSTNDYGGGIAINDNTIIGNSAAQLNRQGGGIFLCNGCRPTVTGNNLYGNISATGSDLYNGNLSGGTDINAENSYWGTADSAVIEDHVWHYLDDSNLGLVDYTPYRTSHNTAAPISPPTGLTATLEGTSIVMSWAPNLESDLAGYKVYWDTDSGYPYAHSVDVGNVTAHTIAGITSGTRYYVTITAYDTIADGDSDWTDGNESWFAVEKALQIWAPPTAAFTATPLSGAAPLTVTFTDQSAGV
ncbi:MAG TPA: right-handed parallel beta-helix repeat-containing protein, partial [Anaerolineae bacterium]|nr:right-handed parallel beta-helix repeat-containing protein [Anaerolineae bacterium]